MAIFPLSDTLKDQFGVVVDEFSEFVRIQAYTSVVLCRKKTRGDSEQKF